MKYLILGLMVLCSLSCQQKSKEEKEALTVVALENNFDWLIGNWQRSNETEGKQTYENWVKVNKDTYQGFGFTIKENDTIWKEDMRLVHVSDAWNFEVKGKGETDATVFILTKIEEDNFICENEANEFPKKISYSKSDHGILAVISGGDLEIPFEFGPFNMN